MNKGRGDFGLPNVSSHVLPLLGLEGQKADKKRARAPGQDSIAVDVEVHRASCNIGQRFKAALFSVGIFCTLAFFISLGSFLWNHRRSSRKNSWDLPLFSGCEKLACKAYIGILKATLNRILRIPAKTCMGTIATGGSTTTICPSSMPQKQLCTATPLMPSVGLGSTKATTTLTRQVPGASNRK